MAVAEAAPRPAAYPAAVRVSPIQIDKCLHQRCHLDVAAGHRRRCARNPDGEHPHDIGALGRKGAPRVAEPARVGLAETLTTNTDCGSRPSWILLDRHVMQHDGLRLVHDLRPGDADGRPDRQLGLLAAARGSRRLRPSEYRETARPLPSTDCRTDMLAPIGVSDLGAPASVARRNEQPTTQSNSGGNHEGASVPNLAVTRPPTPITAGSAIVACVASQPVGLGRGVVVQEDQRRRRSHERDASVARTGQSGPAEVGQNRTRPARTPHAPSPRVLGCGRRQPAPPRRAGAAAGPSRRRPEERRPPLGRCRHR